MAQYSNASFPAAAERVPKRGRIVSAVVALGCLLLAAAFAASVVWYLVRPLPPPPTAEVSAPAPPAPRKPVAPPPTPAPPPRPPGPAEIDGMKVYGPRENADVGIIRYSVLETSFDDQGYLNVHLAATNIDEKRRKPDSKFTLLDEELNEYKMRPESERGPLKQKLDPGDSEATTLVYEVPTGEGHTYYLRVTSDKGFWHHEKAALIRLEPRGAQ